MALQVSSVDCSRSTATRAVSSGTDRCIKVWDLHKGFCTRTVICHSSCNSVRCTRDEHIICSGHFDGTLRFWDLRNGKMANEVTGLHTQQICSVQIGTQSGEPSCHAQLDLPVAANAMRHVQDLGCFCVCCFWGTVQWLLHGCSIYIHTMTCAQLVIANRLCSFLHCMCESHAPNVRSTPPHYSLQ